MTARSGLRAQRGTITLWLLGLCVLLLPLGGLGLDLGRAFATRRSLSAAADAAALAGAGAIDVAAYRADGTVPSTRRAPRRERVEVRPSNSTTTRSARSVCTSTSTPSWSRSRVMSSSRCCGWSAAPSH